MCHFCLVQTISDKHIFYCQSSVTVKIMYTFCEVYLQTVCFLLPDSKKNNLQMKNMSQSGCKHLTGDGFSRKLALRTFLHKHSHVYKA